MSLFNIFTVAGSAMTAQNQRLNVVASNLANADSAVSSNGQPYKAKQVVFVSTQPGGGAEAGSRGSSRGSALRRRATRRSSGGRR